jgi:sugar lactone lactonase YvrE
MIRPLSAIVLCVVLSSAVAAERRLHTIAGSGIAGFSATEINNPYGVSTGPDGALYFCEIGNHVVRRLDLKTGKLSVVAGNGKPGYSGDGGPATSASLNEPYEVRFDSRGDMFFVEMKNNLIRKVDRKTRVISTIAGAVGPGFSGDGGAAREARFKQPHSIAFDRMGALLICDIGNNRIRRIDQTSNVIDTIFVGEPGTPRSGPRAIAVAPNGDLYIAFREGNSIGVLNGKKLRLVAGTGESGYSGDNGPALSARLSGPKGIALGHDGDLYFADTESHTIRRIHAKTGMISTVAGTGTRGDGADGDPLKCAMRKTASMSETARPTKYAFCASLSNAQQGGARHPLRRPVACALSAEPSKRFAGPAPPLVRSRLAHR